MAETLQERIAYLIKFSRGTMPVGMIVATEEEAVQARKLLAGTKNKTAKLITVSVKKEKRK